MEACVKGRGKVGEYLFGIYRDYIDDHFARSKVIWDIATVAWLLNPEWVPTDIVHSPVLTNGLTWSLDSSRHFIRVATFIHRDPVFRDLFTKLDSRKI